jgi:hypothetical protein
VDEWAPEALCEAPNEIEQAELAAVPVIIGPQGPKPKLANTGKTTLNLASFNFTGLAGNEACRQRALDTLRTYGVGSCGPAGFYGTLGQCLPAFPFEMSYQPTSHQMSTSSSRKISPTSLGPRLPSSTHRAIPPSPPSSQRSPSVGTLSSPTVVCTSPFSRASRSRGQPYAGTITTTSGASRRRCWPSRRSTRRRSGPSPVALSSPRASSRRMDRWSTCRRLWVSFSTTRGCMLMACLFRLSSSRNTSTA